MPASQFTVECTGGSWSDWKTIGDHRGDAEFRIAVDRMSLEVEGRVRFSARDARTIVREFADVITIEAGGGLGLVQVQFKTSRRASIRGTLERVVSNATRSEEHLASDQH